MAKGVDYAGEIQRVRLVTTEAEAVEEDKSCVDIPLDGAEVVDLPGPIEPGGDGLLFLRWKWLFVGRGRRC